MRVPHSQSHVKVPDLPLEKLASNNQLSQTQKVAEVSRQFEAVLLRQILTEAQKPAFKSNVAGSSVSTSIYQDLFTQQLADQISRSGSVGLAKTLEAQMEHQFKEAHPVSAGASPSQAAKLPQATHSATSSHAHRLAQAHHSPDTAKRSALP